MLPKIAVTLCIVGSDFDPNDVTIKLGLQPTRSWKKGDIIKNTYSQRSRSLWAYGLKKRSTLFLDDVMKSFVESFPVAPEKVASVTSSVGATALLTFAVYCYGEIPAMCFELYGIEFVRQLNASMDVDFYNVAADGADK